MYNLSFDDLRILADSDTAALVEKHLADDPAQLAFRLKCGREQARLVCQQVKYLGRAKSKLPAYYAARCIIPPLSYEQCSSEATASTKTYSGKLCIDLTCGLGVDSFYFSKSFDRVITVEREPVLAEIARHNFHLLDVNNISVENTSAELFLSAYLGPRADLIYIDPARRSEGERVFLLEDCSPDVVGMMRLLLEKAERVLIKLSPLFDIEEALRVFAGHVSRLEIVSVGGEVKELLVELTTKPESPEILVFPSAQQRFSFRAEDISLPVMRLTDPSDCGYLLAADAAFYKGRLVQALLHRYESGHAIALSASNGFAFSTTLPDGFPGRVYRIVDRMDYQPKHLKKALKEQGLKRINILRRNFSYKSVEIKQALNIQEGGAAWFAFTELNGKATVFRVEPVPMKK